MTEPRHLAMMYVSIDVVHTMLCTGRVTRCIEGIPPDARAVTLFEDLARNAVGFVFEHPSFPVHHPGEVMYALRPAQLQIIEGEDQQATIGGATMEYDTPRWWVQFLDERQQKHLAFCQNYAMAYAHGAPGHIDFMLIATLGTLLDKQDATISELKHQLAERS